MGPTSGRRRDGEAHHLVSGNEARNQPRRLGLLDEGAQERSSGRVLARRADSLLHGSELAIKDTRAGQFFDIAQQTRPQAGQRVELLAHELVVGTVQGVGTHQRRLLDVAIEPEAVGAAAGHSNAHAALVDIGNGLEMRTLRYQVRRLDLTVGRRKGNLRGALWLGPDEPNVPRAGIGRIGELARRLVGHVLDRYAEAHGDLAGHVGRYALRIAGCAAPGHQQEIRQIDTRAQDAGWRQLRDDFLRHPRVLLLGRERASSPVLACRCSCQLIAWVKARKRATRRIEGTGANAQQWPPALGRGAIARGPTVRTHSAHLTAGGTKQATEVGSPSGSMDQTGTTRRRPFAVYRASFHAPTPGRGSPRFSRSVAPR